MQDGTTTYIAGNASSTGAVGAGVNYPLFEALEQGTEWSGANCTGLPQYLGAMYGFLFPTMEEFLYRAFNVSTHERDVGCGEFTTSNPYPPATTPVALYFEDLAENTNWASTNSTPIVPWVGLPTDPEINGESFYQEGGMTSATPTISWSAPTLGHSNLYMLSLYGPRSSILFTTAGTQMTVPPGLLFPGNSYSVALVAVYDAANCAGNGDTQLCELSLNQGGTEAVSGSRTVYNGIVPVGGLAGVKEKPRASQPNFAGNVAYQLQRHAERQQLVRERMEKLRRARSAGR